MTSQTKLRARLSGAEILLAPGVYDGLSALIAVEAGAEAIYLSGASLAYTRFGRPDIGLVGMMEVAETLAAIRDRIDVPVIVDADNGYGNALNVQRTVRTFERAGANAIQIEDQTFPKRCGHLDGKELIEPGEMCGKIKAALDARAAEDVLIIARTDAIAVEGFDAALDRAQAYMETGADVLFIEGPESKQQMAAIARRFDATAKLMANMVEGGKTPAMTAGELHETGFNLVIFPGGLVRAQALTAKHYFDSLLHHGSNQPFMDRMIDFAGINDIVGTSDALALGRQYQGGGKAS